MMRDKKLNILLTSAGRRGYLVDYFKNALAGSGCVHAGNSDDVSPAFFYADKFVVTPLIYDDNYIPFLLDYCKKWDIKAIISLFDIDLMILAKNKQLFLDNGIEVIVSDPNVINICNDKWNTFLFCVNNKILCPKTYIHYEDLICDLNKGVVHFPVIIKPRWGMGSIGIYEANSMEQLKVFSDVAKVKVKSTYLKYESEADFNRCLVYQEKIEGQEFGMDVIHNLNGVYQNAVVRKKIAMRSGETDAAIVVKNSQIEELGGVIGNILCHIANLDVDVFVSDSNIYLLEMNARFGGGYPFSHQAGVDLPKAIVKWLKGEEIDDELNVKVYDHIVQKDIQLIDLSK